MSHASHQLDSMRASYAHWHLSLSYSSSLSLPDYKQPNQTTTNLRTLSEMFSHQGGGPCSHSWAASYCLCGQWHPKSTGQWCVACILLPTLTVVCDCGKDLGPCLPLGLSIVTLLPHFTKLCWADPCSLGPWVFSQRLLSKLGPDYTIPSMGIISDCLPHTRAHSSPIDGFPFLLWTTRTAKPFLSFYEIRSPERPKQICKSLNKQPDFEPWCELTSNAGALNHLLHMQTHLSKINKSKKGGNKCIFITNK